MKALALNLPLAAQVRAFCWLSVVSLVDASSPVLLVAVMGATALDLWLRTWHPRPKKPPVARSTARPLWPVAFVLFGLLMAVNVLVQPAFVDAESSPYLLNIVLTHLALMLWAYITTPTDKLVISAIHKWSKVFICVLSSVLFAQILWRENFGTYLDFRLLLTGEASRSATEEFYEGARPTSFFAEPSNHAIAVFLLMFVHSIAGRRSFWLTLVAIASCLLTNSTMGALLALYLLIDEAARHINIRPTHLLKRLPVLLVGLMVVMGLAFALDASDIFVFAYERVFAPESPYDPIAVRLYVPLKIADFSLYQHLLGSGIANYASFPAGLTLNDSSLLLAAYFQLGIVGLAMLWAPVNAYARNHSRRVALMLLALYLTKLGLLMPAFWALAALAHGRQRTVPVRSRPKNTDRGHLPSPGMTLPAAAREV
jgi:hypothetical protein